MRLRCTGHAGRVFFSYADHLPLQQVLAVLLPILGSVAQPICRSHCSIPTALRLLLACHVVGGIACMYAVGVDSCLSCVRHARITVAMLHPSVVNVWDPLQLEL